MAPVAQSQLYGWAGLIERFLQTGMPEWLDALSDHHVRRLGGLPEEAQVSAWKHCFVELTAELRKLVEKVPESTRWGIVFEYELPRERGRRPDVVIVSTRHFVVLEFKGADAFKAAFADQAAAYVRDLRAYHAESQTKSGSPWLVLMGGGGDPWVESGVTAMGRGQLGAALANEALNFGNHTFDEDELDIWLRADYAPLPTLVSAARSIFNHEPLPSIKRAESAGIPSALRELTGIAKRASSRHEHHLAFVTGVPGAGKTLIGLQFVYATHFQDDASEKESVFLSGNGPLVKVLQHALKSSIFVQDVHGFLRQYGGQQRRLPIEHMWVYDEAQRAWDGEKVREKRGHGASEPEDFLRLGARMGGWAMILALVGEGQEIHIGEEAGLGQWNDAIGATGTPWNVHCPPHLAGFFSRAASVECTASLNLDKSLRQHVAEDVQSWLSALLAGKLAVAHDHAVRAQGAGFRLYVSRVKQDLVNYAIERYRGEETKRFGWIASSKAKNLPSHGINNTYQFTKRFREGPWFNDAPESRDSCCQLTEVATEFQCQGLELDLPLVAWGDDLKWSGAKWESPPPRRTKAKDPHQLRVNSYRVLLSRGRDGVFVFVPPDPSLDPTFEALVSAGLAPL